MKIKKPVKQEEEVPKKKTVSREKEVEDAIMITEMKLEKAYKKKEMLDMDIASMEMALKFFNEELGNI